MKNKYIKLYTVFELQNKDINTKKNIIHSYALNLKGQYPTV